MMKTRFEIVAAEFASAFKTEERSDGSRYTTRKDGCAPWITSDLCREIHEAIDDRLPNDWIYEKIDELADAISSYEDADSARDAVGEMADQAVDIYNSELTAWLASHLGNAALCEEATEEFGMPEGGCMFKQIQMGQYLACDHIAHKIISVIEDEANEREEAEEETED